jgi:rfaE bifunctional protein kinase chain/domain
MRVVAHSQQNNQQIVRIDRESRERIDGEVAAALLDKALGALKEIDAVLISDYNKGVWVPELAHPLLKACREAGKPVTINPKPANIGWVEGASLVTINQFEALSAANRMPGSHWDGNPPTDLDLLERVDSVGRTLRNAFGCDTLFITQRAHGIAVFTETESYHLPAIPAEVFDGTGAGDTVASVTAMTLASGGSSVEAGVLGNAGGALQVHKLGAVAVSAEELLALIVEGKIEGKGAA